VVYVESAEDISTTVKLTQKHSVSFVVCGGKHSSSGASSTVGGLVIDLAKMRDVKVDVNTNTIKVQGGCIWKDVDEAAADYGLAMVGGTVNHTGVGGL
jgi:FAD/FMN-containing dehydrogenase